MNHTSFSNFKEERRNHVNNTPSLLLVLISIMTFMELYFSPFLSLLKLKTGSVIKLTRKSTFNITRDEKKGQITTGMQGWRCGESTRLPPMWPGFDSQIWSHMWVEFVGSLLYTEWFSPGTPVSPLLKNQNLT